MMSALLEASGTAVWHQASCGVHLDQKVRPPSKAAWIAERWGAAHDRGRGRLQKRRHSCLREDRDAPWRALGKGRNALLRGRSKDGNACLSSKWPSDQVVEVKGLRQAAEADLSNTLGDKQIESNENEKVDQATTSSQIGDLNGRSTGIEKLAEAGGVAPSAADKPIESRPLNSSSEISASKLSGTSSEPSSVSTIRSVGEALLLISPFFFWGTAMVAMKEVLPKAGPLFVAATRLLPAGAMLIGFTMLKGKSNPKTAMGWLAVALFALVDGTMFQGFLAQGLSRTTAGLGSVIIDSQPLTVALLAALLFGETIGPLGALGLATGVLGLCLLEIPEDALRSLLTFKWLAGASGGSPGVSLPSFGGLWESGEWWMLLAAQSMAVGTVMVRWVSKYVDPVVATGWHMLLGGVPLLLLSVMAHEPAVSGHFGDLDADDFLALLYTSVFGCAISYGVFFYNASRGNLTKLSSLTFLTPMFAAFFGYLYLDETLTQIQLGGAGVTLAGIYLVNFRSMADPPDSS